MEKLRIVFMGTPDFAVGILDTIYNSPFEIAAVITAPDKPAGRGQKVSVSAVKTYALEKNLPILQPTNLKNEDFLAELASYNANLQIVVAFRMLPEVVWKMPKLGTFNLHASLLPNYRGAAPINWAIINGETETGVTTFFIDDKIDTGAMILNKKIAIDPNENVGQLHDKLMHLGCEAMIETLELIQKGNVTTTIQTENSDLKTAYKLNKDNCKIDWTKSGKEIYNQIRAIKNVVVVTVEQNDFLQSKSTDRFDYEMLHLKFLATSSPKESIEEIKKVAMISERIYGLLQFIIRYKTIQLKGKY